METDETRMIKKLKKEFIRRLTSATSKERVSAFSYGFDSFVWRRNPSSAILERMLEPWLNRALLLMPNRFTVIEDSPAKWDEWLEILYERVTHPSMFDASDEQTDLLTDDDSPTTASEVWNRLLRDVSFEPKSKPAKAATDKEKIKPAVVTKQKLAQVPAEPHVPTAIGSIEGRCVRCNNFFWTNGVCTDCGRLLSSSD